MNSKYIAPNAEIEMINAVDVITLSYYAESELLEKDSHDIGDLFAGFN